jgi:Tfp pilus assembly PilM family ATPase
MAAMASTEQIREMVDGLERVGLNCVRVEVGAQTLVAGGVAAGEIEDGDLWGVLEIGYRTSNLVMALGAVPLLHRSLPVGGDLFTRHVAERLKMEPALAERLRREHPLRQSDRAGQRPGAGSCASRESDRPEEIRGQEIGDLLHAAVRRDLRILAEEVAKSFSYALDAYPNAKPALLILAGGCACWQGLEESLSGLLGIPARVADPSRACLPMDPGTGEETRSPALLRALGLVMPERPKL